MIVLFDSNSYDNLIELSETDLKKVYDRVEKVIMPQAVRKQIDMMIYINEKIAKLHKINEIIFNFYNQKKLIEVKGMFGFANADDMENGNIKQDKKTQRKYYSISGLCNSSNFNQKSLGILTYEKEGYFRSLSDKMKNGDKEIALTAKNENAIVITNDYNFLNSLIKIKQEVLTFEDFVKIL